MNTLKKSLILAFTVTAVSCSVEKKVAPTPQAPVPLLMGVEERPIVMGDKVTCMLRPEEMTRIAAAGKSAIVRIFNEKDLSHPRFIATLNASTPIANYTLKKPSETGSIESADVVGDRLFCDAPFTGVEFNISAPAAATPSRSPDLLIANQPPPPPSEVLIATPNGASPGAIIFCRGQVATQDADEEAVHSSVQFFDATDGANTSLGTMDFDPKLPGAQLEIKPEWVGKKIGCAISSSDGRESRETQGESQISIVLAAETAPLTSTPNPTPVATVSPTPTPEASPTAAPITAPAETPFHQPPLLSPVSATVGMMTMCRVAFDDHDSQGRSVTEATFTFYRKRGAEKKVRFRVTYKRSDIALGLRYAFYRLKAQSDLATAETDADRHGDVFTCSVILSSGGETVSSQESSPIVIQDTPPTVAASSPQTQLDMKPGSVFKPVTLSFSDEDGDSLVRYVKTEDSCDIFKLSNGPEFKVTAVAPDLNYPPVTRWCKSKFKAVTNGEVESSNEVILSLEVRNHAPTLHCTSSRTSFSQGENISGVQCLATDPDLHAKLTYSLDSGCEGVSIDPVSGELQGSMPLRTCTAKATVTDGSESASTPVTLVML